MQKPLIHFRKTMKKIGKISTVIAKIFYSKFLQRTSVLFVLFLGQTNSVVSQKGSYVNLSLSTDKIVAGEVFMLSISSNIAGQIKIALPKEFIKAGVMSESSSDALINNRVVSQIEISQGYYCEKKGTYTVGPAEINGIKSKSSRIEVIGAGVSTNTTDLQKNLNSAPVFGQITCSKKSVYLGEAFVVNSKIYSRYSVAGIDNNYTLSKAKGNLELINLQDPRKYNSGQINIKGVPHIFIDFSKQLCFANKTGKAGLSPFAGNIQIDKGFFPETVHAQSNSLEIDVIPLPKNAPDVYSGLVGVFTYTFNPTQQSVKQGEIVTLHVTINGTGNLHVANPPKLILPNGFEIYGEIERKEEIEYTEEGASGSVDFTFHILANEAGSFIFEKQHFTYFDLQSKTYVSSFSKPTKFTVAVDPSYVKQSNKLELTKSVSSSMSILKIAGALIALFIVLFIHFQRKKKKSKHEYQATSNAKASTTTKQEDTHLGGLNTIKQEPQTISIPSTLSTLEGTPLFSSLHELIVKQLKNVTQLEYASTTELLESLSKISNYSLLVPKIEVLLDELNTLRYGGTSITSKEASDILVHKVTVLLKEFIQR
jgi:hypothetical protein